MTQRRVTQRDVAERSRVSRSTVAAILRNDPRLTFSEETRRRVLEAARELNYRTHSGARALRDGRTRTLALAIPHFGLLGGAIQSQNLRGMGEAAQHLGYSLAICAYGAVRRIKPAFERLMRESRFDGILLHGDATCEEDPREEIAEAYGLPCVVLERRSERLPWVDFDHQAGAALATRHLMAQGRRRIALVGDWYPERRKGYTEALREAGMAVEGRLIWPHFAGKSYADVAGGAIEAMFDHGGDSPDALLCLSDEIAAAAIAQLADRGMRVPEDVAVVGYDDSKLAHYTSPPLTSVQQDGVGMGREAVRLLVQCIDQPDTDIEPVVIQPTLTIRRSCGAAMS